MTSLKKDKMENKTTQILRISGKNLGDLAKPDCCKRCFWIKHKAGNQIPFQIFPGIFSSIDSFTKKVIHNYIDQQGKGPEYLKDIGDIVGYIDPPHNSKFCYQDSISRITLSGDADGILKLSSGSLAILDYKTAKFSKNQDALLPVYEIQLNAYAIISEALGLGKISKLALVYMEPQTDSDQEFSKYALEDGFSMNFRAYTLDIAIDPMSVQNLLTLARNLLDSSVPPAQNKDCKDCFKLAQLYKLIDH